MVYFRYPFSYQIFTTDDLSDQKSVHFISFDTNEIIDFKGNIKESPLIEFLKNEILTDSLPSELIDFKEEKEDETEKMSGIITFSAGMPDVDRVRRSTL
mgnify:CR=1 FL=1